MTDHYYQLSQSPSYHRDDPNRRSVHPYLYSEQSNLAILFCGSECQISEKDWTARIVNLSPDLRTKLANIHAKRWTVPPHLPI
jgi:hypothetical protein